MMLIKIVSGTYGYHKNGHLDAKDRFSEPFEVEDAEADRLVEIGVAEYAAPGTEEAEIADMSVLTKSELLKIAAQKGIDVSGAKNKAGIIDLINSSDSGDEDDMPEIGAMSPEV